MSRTITGRLAAITLTAAFACLSFAGTVRAQDASARDSFQSRTQEEETAQPFGGGFPKETPAPDPDQPVQLTEEDLEQMNNGDIAILHSEDGYIKFLRGRYYDKPVTDYEEGIESLYGIQSLLGISKGSQFYGVYGAKNSTGYSYYVYQQRYGDITLQNAVLKIIVDPDGYTAGLVSSFTPNIGIAPEGESAITAEEAVQIAQREFPGGELRFYPEETRQTSITDPDGIAMHCWAVFSNLPPEYGNREGASYLEHLISYEGDYLYYMSVSSPQEMVYGDDVRKEVARSWFRGLEPDTYTGVVTTHDGKKKEVTVPVAYDPKKKLYYLADVERGILLSDYWTYAVDFTYKPFTSQDNSGWPDTYLLDYAAYISIYDFYDAIGIHGPDGFGCPLLILTDWVEDTGSHTPVKNAAFLGYINGWALFSASSIGHYEECIDVIGHEYTHAVTEYMRGGSYYMNEPGAIDEAISDIAGNLIEMMLGETTDTRWLIAENSGGTLRDMSLPWLYQQPATIGGQFYMPPAAASTSWNDNGGVHTNSSLVNSIAWKLHAAGMDPMEELLLFLDAAKLLTPMSGFKDLQQALLFAAEMRQMDILWEIRINLYCEEAGYLR